MLIFTCFFSFPRPSHEKREAWIRFVQKNRNEDSWLPSEHTLICSTHFKNEDKYITKTGRIYLKKSAVPNDGKDSTMKSGSELVEPICDLVTDSKSILDTPGYMVLRHKLRKVIRAKKLLADKCKKILRQNRYLRTKCESYKLMFKRLKVKLEK